MSQTSAMGASHVSAAPLRWHRGLQLALAAVWLLDGVLQLNPFMFTPGARGFSGMLAGTSSLAPQSIAHSITWNASIVDHHAVVANAAFAAIQLLIGLGIAWRPTVKPALAASVVWSLGVWWFGEGLGGVFTGHGTPLAGGPGAVLIYGLLAILLWPPANERQALPFAAAGFIGERAAKAAWAGTWGLLAFLTLLGGGRAPDGAQSVIQAVDAGQPGWLAALDRYTASLVAGRGLAIALTLAVLAVLIGLGVFLPRPYARAATSAAVVVGLALWVLTENFGMILAGGATDPNSGPPLVLLALCYWPIAAERRDLTGVRRELTTAMAT